MATNEGLEPSDEFDYYPAAAYEAILKALHLERADFDKAIMLACSAPPKANDA